MMQDAIFIFNQGGSWFFVVW